MSSLQIPKIETVLKQTTTKCTVCQKQLPGQVIKVLRKGKEAVIMRRTCPEHGEQSHVIASDASFYWVARGNPLNKGGGCGCGPSCCSSGSTGKPAYLGDNALNEAKKGTIEKLSTCIALIEIVDSCNLACPTCFADSPVGVTEAKLKCHSFDDITSRIQKILDQKGKIEIIQLSGGEPTIHPEFFRLARWIRTNPMIDYLVVNTNGVRIAKDETFFRELGNLFKEFDNIQLYLQFDGVQEAGQVELRGTDLRKMRELVINNCEKIGLPITLAMTVTENNLGNLWETAAYGLKFEHIRGISFQPMFLSGRNSVNKLAWVMPEPITTADIILGLNEQSNGLIQTDDFTPLPCGDPNCLSIGWLFRMKGEYYSPSKFGIDIAKLQAKLPDRINYKLEDLAKCGCEGTELGDLMKAMEVDERNAFRFSIKPFMDARTWDEDRIDRCCTHVIRPDGKLDSFCRYYSMR